MCSLRVKRWVSGAVLVMMVAAVTGCGSKSSGGAAPSSTAPSGAAPSATETVKFAVMLSLTGPSGSYGKQVLTAMQIAVEDLNAGGELKRDGKPFQIAIESFDTASEKAQAATLMQRMAGNKEFLGVLGPVASTDFLTALPLANQLQISIIGTGTTAPIAAASWNPWSFRTSLVANMAEPIFFKRLVDEVGIKKIAAIYDTTNDAMVQEKQMLEELKSKLGYEVVQMESFRANDPDYNTQLTKIVAKQPDAILLGATTEDAARIVIQARALGFKGTFLGNVALGNPKLFELTGGKAEGLITYFPFDAESDRPAVKSYVAKYKTKANEIPSAISAYGYDAVVLYADAVKRVQGALTRQSFRDALGKTSGVPGLSLTYSFNNPPHGDNLTPTFDLYRLVAPGKFEVLKKK